MIQLYTKNKILAKRLDEIGLEFLYLNGETPDLNALFICDPINLLSLCAKYPDVKILVLSSAPNFSEGVALLQKGIRGYGNAYMQKVHLLQCHPIHRALTSQYRLPVVVLLVRVKP